MTRSTRLRQPMVAGLSAAMLIAFAAPAFGENVNIPEGGAVTPGSNFLINFQVQGGCDGLPMDALEVTIPEAVANPLPEGVPGWTVESETVPASDGTSRVSLVRWSGGPLQDGAFYEFGLRAAFPDEPDLSIEFPVVQRCGAETSTSAPTVVLAPRFGPQDLIGLSDSVAAIRAEVEELSSRLGGVDPENLRTRVSDDESAIEEIVGRLDALTERLDALESATQG